MLQVFSWYVWFEQGSQFKIGEITKNNNSKLKNPYRNPPGNMSAPEHTQSE